MYVLIVPLSAAMDKPMEPVPEPETQFFERRRLKTMLKRMALLSLAVGVLVTLYIGVSEEGPSIHLLLATFILSAGSMIVGTFLMTLIYFSSRSGLDADAANHDETTPEEYR